MKKHLFIFLLWSSSEGWYYIKESLPWVVLTLISASLGVELSMKIMQTKKMLLSLHERLELRTEIEMV